MATIAEKLVVAALREGNNAIPFRISHDSLIGDEVELLNFVREHVSSHGQLPDTVTLSSHGFTTPEAPEPTSYYVDELKRRAIWNHINNLNSQLRDAMTSQDSYAALDVVRQMAGGAGSLSTENTSSLLSNAAADVLSDYNEATHSEGLRGVTLGWDSLDAVTLGAQAGDLIVIAGRPGMGKSWCLIEMAYRAWISGSHIGLVTMEMGTLQVARRWIGRHSAINPNFIRAGQLSQWGESRLLETVEELQTGSGARCAIMSGDFEKSVSGVEAFMLENMPDVLYVDAAYLLSPSGARRGHVSKWEQISEVVGDLKRLALKTARPVVISVQFNRNLKKTQGADLSDIAGSDSIPQDASVVLGITTGSAPHETTRRTITQLKNREGENVEFDINFSFTPVDLSEVSEDELDDASEEGWEQ